jgi:hypothetical protein
MSNITLERIYKIHNYVSCSTIEVQPDPDGLPDCYRIVCDEVGIFVSKEELKLLKQVIEEILIGE